jgi:hypothetical protein
VNGQGAHPQAGGAGLVFHQRVSTGCDLPALARPDAAGAAR